MPGAPFFRLIQYRGKSAPGCGCAKPKRAGGHLVPMDAERAALKLCESRRISRGIAEECRLYAVGHQVVWEEPEPDAAE